ncbi:MAG: hypothetical protein DME03_10800 [Candidatus Rokuibacteriota bacterium]|nr:MAG: hypothetical protein DME03_10800 [Candidatus Rokubacteria bacterium]
MTSSQLKAMRDGTVEMTKQRLLLAGRSRDPKLGDQASLDRGFEVSRVETVTSAAQALAAYGKSLAALVTDSQSAELQAASRELVASLGRVPEAKEKLSDKQLEAIGTVVQEVGGLWIDVKRKEAVTTIVRESRQAIDRLCDLLARDFAPGTGWVALQLQVIEDPLIADATNVLYDGRSYDERKRASDAIDLVHGNRMRRTEVLQHVTDAATAMKKANGALAQAVEDSTWSAQDIQAFAERAQSLRAAVKIITTK